MQRRVDEAGHLTDRVRDEYDESPGLNLTEAQMRRFIGADPPICEEVLHRLVDCGFLNRTPQGRYVRKR
jgi:hypothetical protein